MVDTSETHSGVQKKHDAPATKKKSLPVWKRWPGQFVRFGTVGVINTILDVVFLNALLWLFPTTNTSLVLLFNSIAYGVGAMNSFLLNKYWTFGQRQRPTWIEVRRFTITTLLGIACNDILIWLANTILRYWITNTSVWLNASKLFAIAGTVFVSYLGMRLWVFVKKTPANDVHLVERSYWADSNVITARLPVLPRPMEQEDSY